MAKNRKYRSAALRFGPAVKAVFLCLLLGGFGLGYVWQKNQIYELGRQRIALETRLNRLIDLNKKLAEQLGKMRTPLALGQSLKNLNLGPPLPSQIWRLPEPPRDLPKQAIEQQLVAGYRSARPE
jgi:hypothetical protein